MTDDELDDLLRDHLTASQPSTALVRAIVSHRRRQWYLWRGLLVAAAAAALVLAVTPDWRGWRGVPEVSAGAPAPSDVAPAVPEGMRVLALPDSVIAIPGFPAAGDLVSLFVTMDLEEPETVTLLQDVLLVDDSPLSIATTPERVEKAAHALGQGVAALAVHRGTDRWMLLRRRDPLPLSPGDHVDVLGSTLGPERTTRTYLENVVVERDLGPLVLVRVRDDDTAAVLAHGQYYFPETTLVRR